MENRFHEDCEILLGARSSMYGFLARIYRVEADQALLDQIAKMGVPDRQEASRLAEGYALLNQFVTQQNGNTLTELARDYARCFFGAGLPRGTGAYPYESVYSSEKRLLMQDAHDEVRPLYGPGGLKRSKDYAEPEDHLAFELEFMGVLCEKTLNALTDNEVSGVLSYLEKQDACLSNHLLRWIPHFCRDLEKVAQTNFYRAAAMITQGFLETETDSIAELTEWIQS